MVTIHRQSAWSFSLAMEEATDANAQRLVSSNRTKCLTCWLMQLTLARVISKSDDFDDQRVRGGAEEKRREKGEKRLK